MEGTIKAVMEYLKRVGEREDWKELSEFDENEPGVYLIHRK